MDRLTSWHSETFGRCYVETALTLLHTKSVLKDISFLRDRLVMQLRQCRNKLNKVVIEGLNFPKQSACNEFVVGDDNCSGALEHQTIQ